MIRHIMLDNKLRITCNHARHPSSATVLCMGGFTSQMSGTKASSLFTFCDYNKLDCVIFDYCGHGVSEGDFNKCSIHDWYNSSIHVVKHVLRENLGRPLILVGTSMGGWLMLLVAMSPFAKSIYALIGLAPAPDFTETLTLNMDEQTEIIETKKATSYLRRIQGLVGLNPHFLTPENSAICEKDSENILETRGEVSILKNGKMLRIDDRLVKGGREYLVLNRNEISIDCPIILIHSMNDSVIPYRLSSEIAKKVRSNDVAVILTKHGDHLLNDEQSLGIACNAILNFVKSADL